MRPCFSSILFALPVLFALGCGAASEGSSCQVSDPSCAEGLECLDGLCLKYSSKQLYSACRADLECVSTKCVLGYCAQSCVQSVPRGRYRIGDCLSQSEVNYCSVGGIGCCKVQEISDSFVTYDQVEAKGQCSAQP